MKEDILEQIVEEHLQLNGYFTRANVKYRPEKGCKGYDAKQDSVHSDIDIIGLNPLYEAGDPKRIVAVSCKSWQTGFSPKDEMNSIFGRRGDKMKGRWRTYRELANDKWAIAFRKKLVQLTGINDNELNFEHWIVCVKANGNKGSPKPEDAISDWVNCVDFKKRLTESLFIKTLDELIIDMAKKLTTTPAGSEAGRLVQLLKAAGFAPTFSHRA